MSSLVPFILQKTNAPSPNFSAPLEDFNNISRQSLHSSANTPDSEIQFLPAPLLPDPILGQELISGDDPLYEKKKKLQELLALINKTTEHVEHHKNLNKDLERQIEEWEYKLNWAASQDEVTLINNQTISPREMQKTRRLSGTIGGSIGKLAVNLLRGNNVAEAEEYYQFDNEDDNDFNVIWIDESDSASDQSGGEDSDLTPTLRERKKTNSSVLSSISKKIDLSQSLSSIALDTYSDILQVVILDAKEVYHAQHSEKGHSHEKPIETLPNIFVHIKVITQGTTSEEIQKTKGSKTQVVYRNANPVWNQEFYFPISEPKNQSLHLEIWHHSEHPHVISETNLALSNGTYDMKDHVLELKVGILKIGIKLIHRGLHNFGRIKAISKEKLIIWLTPEKKNNRDLLAIRNFCLCYQTYMSPGELYELLEKRFIGPSEENYSDKVKFYRTLSAVRGSIGFFFQTWLSTSPDDFKSDEEWTFKCKKLMEENRKSTYFFDQGAKQIAELKKATKIAHLVDAYFPPKPKGPLPPPCQTSGLDRSSLQIAQQLTLIEYEVLKSIKTLEFIKQKWSKKDKETQAPHILRYITWFNRMVHWFSTEILRADEPEKRAVILGKLIDVGIHFKELKNFNGIMELSSCFHSAAISRLRNTWALLPQSHLDSVDQLNQLMSPNDNFAKYREACRVSEPLFVPYLGLYLTDFTFLDDANPDLNEGGLLNFEKGRMITNRLKQFSDSLILEYDIKSDIILQKSLIGSTTYSENDLFRISKLAEPNSSQTTKQVLPARFDSKAFAKLSKSILSLGEEQSISLEGDKLSKRDWQILLSCAESTTIKKDTIVAKEGTVQNQLFKIKSGKISVKQNRLDKEGIPIHVNIKELGEGEVFGEEALLDKWGSSNYDYIVSSDTAELLTIPAQFVKKLFPTEPGFARRFYGQMSLTLADNLIYLNQQKGGTNNLKNSREKILPDNKNLEASDTSQTKSQETQYKNILTKFKLPTTDTILRVTPAIYKKTIVSSGHLFITQRHILFFSKSFGRDIKEKIDLKDIVKITAVETELTVQLKKISYKFNLKGTESFETIEFIKELQQMRGTLRAKFQARPSNFFLSASITNDDDNNDNVHTVLSENEWDLILKGARHVTFKKGESIVKKGDVFQRINQISRGCARIEIVTDNNQPLVVGHISENELFGEISFLKKSGASAHVIADSEEVDVTIIEGYFINKLFTVNPLFAGNFFKYLCCCLSLRIGDRKKQLGWAVGMSSTMKHNH